MIHDTETGLLVNHIGVFVSVLYLLLGNKYLLGIRIALLSYIYYFKGIIPIFQFTK